MSDDRLREAVEWFAARKSLNAIGQPMAEELRPVEAILRAVLAGIPIWWCEEHGANGDGPLGDGPKPQALHPCCLVAMLAACEDVDLAKPCHMVEVEICVGAKLSPAEVRAAVVPLLNLEAAAIAEYENRGYLAETWGDNDSWVPYVDDTRAAAKRVVYAALGLGEES